MRTLVLANFIILFLIVPLFYSCEEVDPPVSDFSSTQTDSTGDIYVKFTDMSTNSPDHWEWKFEGGFPKTSKEQNPTIVYKEPGVFDVELIASNEGGSNEIIKYAHINVARIINNMPTDAEVTLGNQTKIAPSISYVQFVLFDQLTAACHVETSGESESEKQQGLLIYWDITVDLSEYYFYEFGLGPGVVFFNITNNSDYTFTHFQANYNNPEYESLEEITLLNDGEKHEIGYYVANSNMEVRTYCPEGYVSWIEGYNFLMPWDNNQSVDLELGKSNIKMNSDYLDYELLSPKTSYSKNISKKSQNNFNKNPDILYTTPTGVK